LQTKIYKILAILILAYSFQQTAHAAQLSMYTKSDNLIQNCKYNADIIVDTEGINSRGTDAIIYYNQNDIEILSINTGNIYESYPKNTFDEGIIYITGYSSKNTFNGRGVLAKINFKSKKDVESTTMHFAYALNSTKDSNISGENSGDILNKVNNLQLNFNSGLCNAKKINTISTNYITQKSNNKLKKSDNIDNQVPWVDDIMPKSESINVLPNTNITFTIKDDSSGVDLESLNIKVNNILYTKDGENTFNYEGEANEYKITIDPKNDLLKQEDVNIEINSKDITQNGMPTVIHTFKVYNPPEDALKTYHSSAPTKESNKTFAIFSLILLINSILLNIFFLYKKTIKK